MSFSEYFSIYNKLSPEDQKTLSDAAVLHRVSKGTLVHDGTDCLGLLVIRSGQLRTFICSNEGKEVTLFRLFDRDTCLFTASCMMSSVQFDMMISAEKDTEFWVIPPRLYKTLSEKSAPLANYVNELMASHLTDILWLIEQIMWKSVDKRLANFLLEESALEASDILKLTHEAIANHLGTHREVVTRMLRYFQSEGMVRLSRGTVEITDAKRLSDLQDE
jgi:CRP/FNR family transcriptional regulator